QTLMGTVEVEEVLRHLLEIAQEETNADRARLYTFEADKITHFYTQTDDEENEQYQKACHKLAQLIFEDGQQMTLNLKQVSNDYHQALLEELEAHTIIATPLKSQNRNLGALVLIREKDDFTPSDSEFLAVLSSQAGIALENARLFTEIQQAYKELQTLDDMKSEFINIAAHELRTPLAILVGYATVLEEELVGIHHLYLT
ncbi:MAG: GAF domain-containing protein, partial [Planctomycetes bacterium]|nr:GAF domain-containing protein [Planctomycetota bacterium]